MQIRKVIHLNRSQRGSMLSYGCSDRSTSSKRRKCHLYLPRPIHACPRHGSWATLLGAKSCKVEGASSWHSKMGIYQLRETTLTENIVLPGLLEVGIGLTTQSVKKNNSYEIWRSNSRTDTVTTKWKTVKGFEIGIMERSARRDQEMWKT